MAENTQELVDIDNFAAIDVPAKLVVMNFYRSPEAIKYTFLFYLSTFEFNHKLGDYAPMMREKEIRKGTELDGFTNPESVSGQAVGALDAMIAYLFELEGNDKVDWYQIDGRAKIISAHITTSNSYGIRYISPVEQVPGGLTFDKVTEGDKPENQGNGLLKAVRDACFANLAGRDANDFPARIRREQDRQAEGE